MSFGRPTSRRSGDSLPAALLFVAVTLATGCGDDGGPSAADAYTYQGFWIVESVTADFGSGMETRSRDGSPDAVRWDMRLTATSPTDLDLSRRFVLTTDDVPTQAPEAALSTVAIERERWIVSEPNDPADPSDDTTRVFDVVVEGGQLTLDVDPTDPRHDATGGPQQMVLTRHAPWGETAVGSWIVGSLDTGTGPFDPAECVGIGMGQWSKETITFDVDASWLLDQTSVTDVYGSMSCVGMPDVPGADVTILGYLEEESGELRAWLYDPASPAGGAFMTIGLTEGVDTLTLDRTACTPDTYCMGAPLQWILVPQ